MKDAKKSPESTGYTAIEAFIEQSEPDITPMQTRYAELLALSKSAKLAQEKAAAKIAAGAYNRFFSLVDELLNIKKSLQPQKK